ncbi:uncharacterized protein L203_106359 [Cryptococcus depauperatus CBS 7841]|uniref:Uncharacterized protein n=1 Tax=Cryptococcus depauperatus CBS 7841 TaxID=1295531 RepID=A0A1E3IJ57_9TREE|nr:hypothetical protein L203_02640 [Cryptococcus depauperatus CBS 7841]
MSGHDDPCRNVSSASSKRSPHPIVFEKQTGYASPYSPRPSQRSQPQQSRPPDDLGKSSIASHPSNVPMNQSGVYGMRNTDLDEQSWQSFEEEQRWQAFLEKKQKNARDAQRRRRKRIRDEEDAKRRAELGQPLATSSTATLDPNTSCYVPPSDQSTHTGSDGPSQSTSQRRDHFSGQLPPFSDFLSTVSNPNANLPEPPGRKE